MGSKNAKTAEEYPPQVVIIFYRDYDNARAFYCSECEGRRFLDRSNAEVYAAQPMADRSKIKHRKLSPFQDVTDSDWSKSKFPPSARVIQLESRDRPRGHMVEYKVADTGGDVNINKLEVTGFPLHASPNLKKLLSVKA